MKRFFKGLTLISGILVRFSATVWADDKAITAAEVQRHADFVWTLVAAFLVFFMQAGFAIVEAGFTRAKNAVNIMMKNLMDFAMGSIAFWAVGFGIMFGENPTGWFGTSGFFFSDFAKSHDPWLFAFWIFQVVFAATAATIVSGAMAERMPFNSITLLIEDALNAYRRASSPLKELSLFIPYFFIL